MDHIPIIGNYLLVQVIVNELSLSCFDRTTDENSQDEILKVDYFKALRNDIEIIKIMSTLARDPAGVS